ncbi:MAG: alpha/beta hydrolase [Bifidobacteriaceae bacterium]|jgi:pimeloyl-ACP methyl ester carboxylesterase|nr:alpha/beta hydrolase [Bifidobacteriaceae bacterium]
MPVVDLPANVRRRPPPLRKRIIQRLGWIGFVGGGALTPRLAGKAAARVWCKLPANAGRRKDNRPWPGQISRLRSWLGSDLVVETWEPQPGPDHQDALPDAADQAEPKTVLLVHGWGGWRGQVASFVAPLTRAGFKVVAFDALAHGDSGPGEQGAAHSSGGELVRSLENVVGGIGQPYGVIAHSLGCAAVCRAYLDGNLSFTKLTLVSPSPDMRQVAHTFSRTLGFGRRAEAMLTEEMEKRSHGRLGDFDIADMGATGRLPSALVIHDSVDRESPYHVAQDIEARWPGATLVTTEGLGHHRILIDPAVVAAAAGNIIGVIG